MNLLLIKLLAAYVNPGRGLVFALAHVALSVYYVYLFRRIRVEARSLKDWKPAGVSKSQCGQALDDFLLDCDRMAPHGILPPLTDFSDRLDSIVDGMIGRLHDLVNLFLVVGIAGTVYGLFEFVVNSGDLNDRLTSALARAMPVVFMGLLWYVLGYLAASPPEQDLRDALAKSTREALTYRRLKAQSVLGAIQEALKPLQQLETTLTHVIEPVIKEWGENLQRTYEVVRQQMAALESAVRAVNAGVEGIRTSVDELRNVTEALKELLGRTPAVLERLDALSTSHAKRLEELSQTIERVNEAAGRAFSELASRTEELKAILLAFQGLPEELRQSILASLQAINERLPEAWKGATDKLLEMVANIVERIHSETQDAAKKIEGAGDNWARLCNETRGTLQTAFQTAVENVREVAHKELPKIEDAFAGLFPDAVSKMKDAVSQWESLAARLTTLNGELVRLLGQVRTIQFPGETITKLDQIRQAIEQPRSVLGDGSGRTIFAALAQFDNKVAQGLQTVNEQVRIIAERQKGPRRPWWPWARS